MKTSPLYQLTLAASLTAGALIAGGPAQAQDAPKWTPKLESVIIAAKRPERNYRMVLSSSRLGEAYFISASIDVPFSDLNLARDPDADELGRRVHAAARVICHQLDMKYPPAQYPILEGFDCVDDAARNGMEQANLVIAKRRQ